NAFAANAVSSAEQGRAAGAISSAMGVGAMLGPIVGGIAYQMSGALPFFVAAAAFATASLLSRGNS
ncbi:MAG: MFS transporter, partial [Pseudomonadota bacterium]